MQAKQRGGHDRGVVVGVGRPKRLDTAAQSGDSSDSGNNGNEVPQTIY